MSERDRITQPLPQIPPATRDPKFDRDPKFNEATPGRDYVPTDAYSQEWVPPQPQATPFQKVDQVIDQGFDAFTRGFFALIVALAAALGVFMLAHNFSPWMHQSGLSIIPAGYAFWAVSRRIVYGKWV